MTVHDDWISVPDDGKLDKADLNEVIGLDLWICVVEEDGYEHVFRGQYLTDSMLGEGFYVEPGDGHAVQPPRRVTHYWPRDYPPPRPSRMHSWL